MTTIADALALQKALDARKVGQWKRETDEECEDADGNVYNKKTYEDLRRQGLIKSNIQLETLPPSSFVRPALLASSALTTMLADS